MNHTRLTVTITREQIEKWSGRPLTDDEINRLNNAIPMSSIPDAIEAITASFGVSDTAIPTCRATEAAISRPTPSR